MSDFIIATDMHVIRKSDVVIVSPLLKDDYDSYYFIVTVSSGTTVYINCTTGKTKDESHIERDVFLRSLTN